MRITPILLAACFLAMAAAPTAPAQTTSQPSTTAAAPLMMFQFEATSVDAILTEMSRRYGCIIIQRTPVQTPITVQNPTPLNARQAEQLLDDLLYPLGYTTLLTLTPEGRTLVRILTVYEKKHMEIPIYRGADPDQIPNDDSVRTQIIPLTHVDAKEIQMDLTPLLSGGGGESPINTASNAIVITDTSAKIKRLAAIIQKLDKPIDTPRVAPQPAKQVLTP